MVKDFFKRLYNSYCKRQTQRVLYTLSDRQLRDIGVDRYRLDYDNVNRNL